MIFHSRGVELLRPTLEDAEFADLNLWSVASSNPNYIDGTFELLRFGGNIGESVWKNALGKMGSVLEASIQDPLTDAFSNIIDSQGLNMDPKLQPAWGVGSTDKNTVIVGASDEYVVVDIHAGPSSVPNESNREWRVRMPLGQLAIKDIEDVSSFAIYSKAGSSRAYYPFDITSHEGLAMKSLRGYALGLRRVAENMLAIPKS